MSNYLIELAVIHTALTLGYFLLLRKEHQYGQMRFFLLVSTLLALSIPLLKLPNPFYAPQDFVFVPTTSTAPVENLVFAQTAETSAWPMGLLIGLYAVVSLFIFFRFLWSLAHIIRIKQRSKSEKHEDYSIRKTGGIKGSFSFFNWIFLSEDIAKSHENYEVILKHEHAHAALGHTYDRMFLELFKIAFWWLPSSWYVINEIKKIHEYQADAHAIKACNIDRYSSILISSTLKTNGWSLASSFHDGLILKRLKAMKEQSKNVRPWKMGTLSAVTVVLFLGLACSEEPSLTAKEISGQDSEIKSQNESQLLVAAEVLPEYPGGLGNLYTYVAKQIQYPKNARVEGIEGKIWVQFTIDKDGSIKDEVTVKGIHDAINTEAETAFENAMAFRPASQGGRPVRVRRVMPIIFKLDREKPNPDGTPGGIIIIEELVKADLAIKIEASYTNGAWTGIVYDDESEYPLPGANIIVEGGTQGTVSAMDGSFSLKADPNQDIVVSFMGYQTMKFEGKQ